MSLLKFLLSVDENLNKNTNNSIDEAKEKEMNDLGLYDYEKKVVKEGQAEPEDFDEDDPSNDDDYYHEDE